MSNLIRVVHLTLYHFRYAFRCKLTIVLNVVSTFFGKSSIDKLITLVQEAKVVFDDIITHKVPLSEASNMYDIPNKKEDNCVKGVLKP